MQHILEVEKIHSPNENTFEFEFDRYNFTNLCPVPLVTRICIFS